MKQPPKTIPAHLLPKVVGEVHKQSDAEKYKAFIKETEGKGPKPVDPRKNEKTRMKLPDNE
ncbi:MAG: hypothetical protein EBU46_00705 [Nitrosomonadaceae bacterium]|nr:hypothetical protein [Nitrosomonadaceae bacterium]